MVTIRRNRNRHLRTGFIAGLLAGIVATAVMLLVSVVWNGISLPEIFGSELTALMPPPLFNFLHAAIGGDAKHYLFYGILVGQCLVFGLSGALYNLAVNTTTEATKAIDKRPYYQWRNLLNGFLVGRQELRWYDGLVLALILWLLVGFGLLPLTGAGIFGAQLTIGFENGMLSLAVVGVVFGLLFVSIWNWLAAQTAVPVGASRKEPVGAGRVRAELASARGEVSRRDLLRRGVIVVGIGLLGVGLWRFITEGATTPSIPLSRLMQNLKNKIVPPPVPNYGVVHPAPFLSPEVTSNDQYYIVSKNLFADPTVNGNSWKLVVDGEVDHPFVLTYQQVLALPMQQQHESMMCVSNEVGGEYMSNALWEGVPLKVLLQRAGVKVGATKVVFHAVDDYSDSIHLSKALEPTTLMAVRMNGVSLPDSHGFPARMLVPGIYGMKHCKWLSRIEVVNYDYQGYWVIAASARWM
jgi:DMSO/TMAO reductase YedYZ molybdopterin-dependent catalytic subunit